MNAASSACLAELYGKEGTQLKRLLSRLLANDQDADDLCQEVCIRLLRMNEDVLIRDPRAFIYRIAANVASDWRRRPECRTAHVAIEPDSLVAEGGQPDAVAATDQELKRIQAGFTSLPYNLREVLIMHRLECLTREEIAESLGVSVGAVKKYLTQALGSLRIRLLETRECGEQTPLLHAHPGAHAKAG